MGGSSSAPGAKPLGAALAPFIARHDRGIFYHIEGQAMGEGWRGRDQAGGSPKRRDQGHCNRAGEAKIAIVYAIQCVGEQTSS
jgi:hypothetical protein